MTRLERLEKALRLIDRAADLIEDLPRDDKLRNHLPALEGNSNGGWIYREDDDADFYFLRDHLELEILKEKGELLKDCDPAAI
jgi:hypothetical protein